MSMKTFLKIFIGLALAIGLFLFAFYRTPEERAFTDNLTQAKQGSEEAALEVAHAYARGVGVKQNAEQALQWYQQVAAQGNSQAAWELAKAYEQGDWLQTDPEAAFTYLLAAAQGGNAQAQVALGNLYELGEKVPQHEGQALFWFLQAAQNGNTQAQTKVSAIEQQNPSLYTSVLSFLQTLQQAGQDNEAQAQLTVGQAYRYGTPILRDDESAFKWFEKAWKNSQQTLSQAAWEMSDQYYKGEGVDQDENRGANLLAQAAEQQNPAAQYQMGEFAYADNPARLEDAFAWFSNAAMQEHAQAQYMTGFMLLQGQGTKKSLPLAIEFFEKSAQQNNVSAQYVLGQIYFKGLGVKKDIEKGTQWLSRAAENGSQEARALLGN